MRKYTPRRRRYGCSSLEYFSWHHRVSMNLQLHPWTPFPLHVWLALACVSLCSTLLASLPNAFALKLFSLFSVNFPIHLQRVIATATAPCLQKGMPTPVMVWTSKGVLSAAWQKQNGAWLPAFVILGQKTVASSKKPLASAWFALKKNWIHFIGKV